MILFSKIIDGIDSAKLTGDAEVKGICFSSALAKEGFCFFALKGEKADGHKFIDDAIKRGATSVVCEKKIKLPDGVACAVVPDSRLAMAIASSKFYGEPSKFMKLIGVTGTNGKTTTTYLLEAVFRTANINPAVIGTIEYRFADKVEKASHTTPESADLQELLCRMVDAKVDACAMEVSSHALSQDRVAGCSFDGAIFTNLTPEHLDYHDGMEDYFAAKAILFEKLLATSGKKSFAIINADDEYGKRLVEKCPVEVLTYGIDSPADVSAHGLEFGPHGVSFRAETPAGSFHIKSALFGRFNVLNMLGVIAAAVKLEIPVEVIRTGLESLKFVKGRFQPVENSKGVLAVVDYAHTPDALENVLNYARELSKISKGKLITVFGCGGDRDKIKRPAMGDVAAKLSDVVIVTSDNPRSEKPEAIIEEIVAGVEKTAPKFDGQYGFEVIADRKHAIQRAVRISKKGDVIVVAGKGHEDYQILGEKKIHFDDVEVLTESFKTCA